MVCPNCGRKMKQQFIGLPHCKCGMSWKRVMKALRIYHKCESVIKIIQTLGYPSREMLYQWEKSGDGKELRDHLGACAS